MRLLPVSMLAVLAAAQLSALGADETARAVALVNQASALAADGKADEALSLYKEALVIDPKNSRAHFNMGNVFRRLKYDYNSAIEEYKQALELEPKLVEAWNMQGLCYKRINKAAAAESCFKRALSIKPEDFDSLSNLAYFYYGINKHAEAQEYFLKAAALPQAKGDKDLFDMVDKLEKELGPPKKQN